MMPVLNPSGVREFIEFGLHGWAMSRYSGCWVGFKSIADTIETSSSFEIDPMAVDIRIPDTFAVPPQGFSIRWPDPPLEQERRLLHERIYAALEYVRLNQLNRQLWHAPQAQARHRHHRQELPGHARGARPAGHRRAGGAVASACACSRSASPGRWSRTACASLRKAWTRSWWSRRSARSSSRRSRSSCTTRPRVRTWSASSKTHGEWVGVPGTGFVLPPSGELTPATIAHAIADRIAKVLGESALSVARPLVPGPKRCRSRRHRPDAAAAAAVLLLGLPAQHVHQSARGLAGDGRHRLPRHGDVDGPQHVD